MSETNGWRALAEGRLSDAEREFFEIMSTDRGAALRGLIRVRLEQSRPAEAAELAQNLVKFEPSAMSMALYGEAMGSMGRRTEAEEWLLRSLQADPQSGWVRAVLGEQRVRRGQWEEGTKDLIASLNQEDRAAAFSHITVVLSDLSRAVAAGVVNPDDATALVNRIDSSAANKTREMGMFFALARNAFGARRAMDADELPPRVFVGAAASSVPTRRERPPEVDRPKEPRAQSRMASRAPIPASGVEHHIDEMESTMAGAPPLATLMDQDRRENEALLDLVIDVGLPTWPSKLSSLDEIPAVRPELLNYSPEILRRSDMQMTKGSVAAQILVSRGVELLSAAVAGGAALPPEINLNGLAHVEVRCLDGVLDRLVDISDSYNLEEANLDKATLALGSFLGTVATKMTPAVWEYDREAMQSVVVLGSTKMHPFRAAQEWLSAVDKDDAYLDYPIRRLLAAAGRSTELEPVADVVADLKDTPLRLRLAQLWMNYLPRAALASQVDIADDISVIEDTGTTIVFGMDPRWLPAAAMGPRNAALVRPDRGVVAYVRRTGEFLLLGRRQHFARFLKSNLDSLDGQTASVCLQYFVAYHRPHTTIVSSGDKSPRIGEGKDNQQVLLFWMQRGATTTGYQLIYHPTGLLTWRLELQSA